MFPAIDLEQRPSIRRRAVLALAVAALAIGGLSNPGSALANGAIQRVSVASDGSQALYGPSLSPAMSATGRYIAFESRAPNLVPGDRAQQDIFVHDRRTGSTNIVSVSSAGAPGKFDSMDPSISADGQYVAFVSGSPDLVPGDTNGAWDVFVHDGGTGETERVSVASDGSQANATSDAAMISGNGRYVAFASQASNLVPGDTNSVPDIFVRDLKAGTTERVSVAAGGEQADLGDFDPSISDDGRYVAFGARSSNLVPQDTNGVEDVFVRDRDSATTERVSVNGAGGQALAPSYMGAISGDGRYVAFGSRASNLVGGDTNRLLDVFVRDLQAGTTERVSVGADDAQLMGPSAVTSISNDGRYVAFDFHPTLPLSRSGGALLRDRQSNTTEELAITMDGTAPTGETFGAAISDSGRLVAFGSDASNLVPGDTNGTYDIFVRDRSVPALTATVPSSPANANDPRVMGLLAVGGASSVELFKNSTCSGNPSANGTVSAFTGAGIVVHVPDDRTTKFSARAVNDSGAQPCSNSIRYVEDSSPPNTILDGVPPRTTADSTPKFTFHSSERHSTFRCRIDSSPAWSCASPATTPPLRAGAHAFRVRAVDRAGNADPTPAIWRFTVVGCG